MSKKIVSKCGARFQAKKNLGVIRTLTDEEEKEIFGKYPEKKTPQKRTPKKAILEFDNGALSILDADNENENLDGVSV